MEIDFQKQGRPQAIDRDQFVYPMRLKDVDSGLRSFAYKARTAGLTHPGNSSRSMVT